MSKTFNIDSIPAPSNKILLSWAKQIEECLGVKITRITLLKAFFFTCGFFYSREINPFKAFCDYSGKKYNRALSTHNRERLGDAITLMKIGLEVPKYRDSEEYKKEFWNKLELIKKL